MFICSESRCWVWNMMQTLTWSFFSYSILNSNDFRMQYLKNSWLWISETSIHFLHCRKKKKDPLTNHFCWNLPRDGIRPEMESLKRMHSPNVRAAALLCWGGLKIVAASDARLVTRPHAEVGLVSWKGDSRGNETVCCFSGATCRSFPLQAVSGQHLSKSRLQHELQSSQFTLGSAGWQEEHCPVGGTFGLGLSFICAHLDSWNLMSEKISV